MSFLSTTVGSLVLPSNEPPSLPYGKQYSFLFDEREINDKTMRRHNGLTTAKYKEPMAGSFICNNELILQISFSD